MVTKRARSFHRFLKTVESFTEGQVRVGDWDCDRLASVSLEVKPNAGYYKGGLFKFTIYMRDNFPNDAPDVWCHTDVFHPNIDPTMSDGDGSNVCVNTLDEWQSGMGLEDMVQALLFLFHNPNPEDPLSPYVSGFCDSDNEWEEFGENVLKAMKGGEVEGHVFENCWCDDVDAKNKDVDDQNAETIAVGGACAVPEESSCVSDVDIIIKKVDEIILTRTEAGKDESEDEMAENSEKEDGDEDEDEDNTDEGTRNVAAEGNSPAESQLEQSVTELNAQNTESNDTQVAVTVANQDESQVQPSAEGGSSQPILSRQNSKLDKDLNMATCQEIAPQHGVAEVCDSVDSINAKANCDEYLGEYLNRYKTCSFVAPDFDQALYTLSVICVYTVMKAFPY